MSLVSLSDWFTEASKFSPAPSSDLLILYFQAARDSRVVGDAVFRALSLGWIYFLTLREYLINLEVEKSPIVWYPIVKSGTMLQTDRERERRTSADLQGSKN